MNKSHVIVCIQTVLLLISSFCFSESIGVITYKEGEVSITRDEAELEDVDADTMIENYDVITTGNDGFVEMDMTTTPGQTLCITVMADTVFSVEIDEHESSETTTFEMFTGSLALKVGTLMKNETVDVQTESASMGVRGTLFEVTSEVTGDLLITCEEGEVVCIDEDGEEQTVEPGFVVEKNPGEKFRRNNIKKEELMAFRKEWRNNRRDAFKKDGLPAFRRYAVKFDRLYTVLIRLADELKKHADILERWKRSLKTGKKPPANQLKQDIKKIEPVLVEMKKVMNIFERVVTQLKLMEPYHQQGYLKGDMKKGFKVEQFYKQMKKKLHEITGIFKRVRRVVKLFIRMNNGHFPRQKARVKFDHDFDDYNPEF
ncbi:MAG: FecR domain-containing protein [Spirochaetales bacterium]|nr:FecR domain-containing protein [Spirochaetales bacterium]